MTRKKVKCVFISNNGTRKTCLRKRRVGLLKKVSELTVLCGLDAFCIIYSPDDNETMVWPCPLVVHRLLMRYQNLPEIERYKKSIDQENYLNNKIMKAKEEFRRHQKENIELDLSYYMQQFHQGRSIDEFTLDELTSFAWLVQEKLIEFMNRIEYLEDLSLFLSSNQFPTSHVANYMDELDGLPKGDEEMVDSKDALHWDQWSIENMMNNNDELVVDASSNFSQVDIGIPYRINKGTLIARGANDMRIPNPIYADANPRITHSDGSNKRLLDLVENFQGGLRSNHLTVGVDYGAHQFEFINPTYANLMGVAVNNSIEENSNAAKAILLCDDVKGRINGTNWNSQMVIPNENILGENNGCSQGGSFWGANDKGLLDDVVKAWMNKKN